MLCSQVGHDSAFDQVPKRLYRRPRCPESAPRSGRSAMGPWTDFLFSGQWGLFTLSGIQPILLENLLGLVNEDLGA
jgi:hypothetical protein